MGTYAEARQEYCAVMGEELGTAYHLLWNECALLHMRWEEYVEMFGKSQAEFDIMNRVAPGFFKAVQDMSWEFILLGLCKFADPAVVAHKRTLSLDALLKFSNSKSVPTLPQLVDTARKRIKFAQDWRNRHIAHIDYERALDKANKPLQDASRASVREALSAIHAVLEAIDIHFTGSGLIFDGKSYGWGGSHLLNELRLVSRLRAERKARIASGAPTPEDLDWQKWR